MFIYLFTLQTKDKDSSRDVLEKKIREISAKSHDLELQIGYLKKDNDMFVNKNMGLQDEVMRLTDQIKDMHPRLLKLEPELNRLSEEKSLWTTQREHTERDLQEYKAVCAALQDLNHSLQTLSTSDTSTVDGSRSVGGADGRGDVMDSLYSVSEKHVMWCGLPSLRRLSAPLYDQIRLMFQDVRKMEKELNAQNQ